MKIKWKPYMGIDYKNPRMKESIYCMLISINFDDEILELHPIGDNYYQQSFFSSIQNCSIAKRLRIAAKEGHVVKEEIPSTISKQQKNFKNTMPAS